MMMLHWLFLFDLLEHGAISAHHRRATLRYHELFMGHISTPARLLDIDGYMCILPATSIGSDSSFVNQNYAVICRHGTVHGCVKSGFHTLMMFCSFLVGMMLEIKL